MFADVGILGINHDRTGEHPASDSAAGENSSVSAGPDLAVLHAAQRPALMVGAGVLVTILGAGATKAVMGKRSEKKRAESSTVRP